MNGIEIRAVSKTYGKTVALRDVSARIAPGKICGFLGRNGAGKTTLLNIISNRIFAGQGAVWIDGAPALENDEAQRKLFYITEQTLYPDDMRAKDVLGWTRNFYPQFDMAYANGLAERFKLDPAKKIGALSTGYRTIFKLVLALASGAPYLLFDEPVLGLDANHRDLFYRELIALYNRTGSTVVLSTHLIEEVAGLLEDVIILNEGRVLLAQPLEELLQMAYTVSGSGEAVDRYSEGKKVLRTQELGRYKAATIFQPRTGAESETLVRMGLDLTPARLQDLFISLTDE